MTKAKQPVPEWGEVHGPVEFSFTKEQRNHIYEAVGDKPNRAKYWFALAVEAKVKTVLYRRQCGDHYRRHGDQKKLYESILSSASRLSDLLAEENILSGRVWGGGEKGFAERIAADLKTLANIAGESAKNCTKDRVKDDTNTMHGCVVRSDAEARKLLAYYVAEAYRIEFDEMPTTTRDNDTWKTSDGPYVRALRVALDAAALDAYDLKREVAFAVKEVKARRGKLDP